MIDRMVFVGSSHAHTYTHHARTHTVVGNREPQAARDNGCAHGEPMSAVSAEDVSFAAGVLLIPVKPKG